MTRWTDMTAAEIAKVSARNRASRTHKLGDTVQDSRDDTHLAKPAQNARHGDPGKESGQVQGIKTPRKRTKSRTRISEHAEQVLTVQWFDEIGAAQYGLDYRTLIAIPNGAHLAGSSKLRGFKMFRMKAEGFRPGAPDLCLAVARRHYFGLFVEMKAADGQAKPHQREYHAVLRAQGYRVEVCRGFDEARRVIEEYLNGRE